MIIKAFSDNEFYRNLVEGEATGIIDKAYIANAARSNSLQLVTENKVWDKNDNEILIKDYFQFGDNSRWKLAQLFLALNKEDEIKKDFDTDDLPPLIMQCAFCCIIKYQQSTLNPDKKYMNINKYIKKEESKDSIFERECNNQAAQDFFK